MSIRAWWHKLFKKAAARPAASTEFPMVFTSCLWCGCPGRIAQLAIQPEVDTGKVSKELLVATRKESVAISDPKGMVTSAFLRVLTLRYDHCAFCGREYLVSAVISNEPNPHFGLRISGIGQAR